MASKEGKLVVRTKYDAAGARPKSCSWTVRARGSMLRRQGHPRLEFFRRCGQADPRQADGLGVEINYDEDGAATGGARTMIRLAA
jgi:hypothetical protein